MSQITAKVVAHSICNDIEIISVQTRAPKFLDAEVEKHRMLATNSSSDRAIPFSKLSEKDFFLPNDVRKNQPGMQGVHSLSEKELEDFHVTLRSVFSFTVGSLMGHQSIHKQHLNRYLLGFSMQDKIITGNKEQFDYFFSLRDTEHADPAIQVLARKMKLAINESRPKVLNSSEWHLPYVSLEKRSQGVNWPLVSAARCARVSYLNHDQSEPDIEKDIDLAERLIEHKHWSCFEHQLTPMLYPSRDINMGIAMFPQGVTHWDKDGNFWSGNHRGWIQLRKLVGG